MGGKLETVNISYQNSEVIHKKSARSSSPPEEMEDLESGPGQLGTRSLSGPD